MEVSMVQYPPGDPRLVDKIVNQLKSQGIFDRFRRECIADVDTKPAYQNLHQRVESSVSAFLAQQEWKPDLNKNQVRDSLRKHIHESGFLDIGVERIVDQVVNPKIVPVFLPQVEEVVYSCLGIERAKKNKESFNVTMCPPLIQQLPEKKPEPLEVLNEMLPKDLDPISPESDTFKDEVESENDQTLGKDKITEEDDDDEEEESSPPFEPIERINPNNESNGSNLSDISGLTSEDSQITDAIMTKGIKLDVTSQESQLSKASCNSKFSLDPSEDQHSSSKTIGVDEGQRSFSFISDKVSTQKSESVEGDSFQQSVEGDDHLSTHEEAHMSNGDKNKPCENSGDKLQKLDFELSDSVSIHTEEIAKSCTDESDTKSHHGTGIELCDISEIELPGVKNAPGTVTFSEIFKGKNVENHNSIVVKSEQGCVLDDNKVQENSSIKEFIKISQDLKHSTITQKGAHDFVVASVANNPINEKTFDKSENLISANSFDSSFNLAETESYPTLESPFTNYTKVTKDIDMKSDIPSDADTNTQDSHHYDSINDSCSINDTKFQEFRKSHEDHVTENPKDSDNRSKRLSFTDVFSADSKQGNKDVLKQVKKETETKNGSVLLHQKDKLEDNVDRTESANDLLKGQGKKEQIKDGSKERSRSEKETNRHKYKHDKSRKDSNKYHSKDDRKKEGSKGHTRHDDSKERHRHSESKERTRKDDKEGSKERYKNEDKSDKERSKHDSKSEKDRVRDHSRHEDKYEKNSHKDRKEGNKDSSKREKGREKDDKSKTASKEKSKNDEKNDKYKPRIDEKYRQEKEKTRNENLSSRSTNQENEYKEKHKSDGKQLKDKLKHEKSKHISEGKDEKSNEEKQGKDKEKTNKEDHKEKLRDSGDGTEKSNKDKSKHHEKDKKSYDKSRESSSSSSSRKSDKKMETSKSKWSEDKNKEKKRESKSKAVYDDHFVHRDKNTEDRRSTDRDSNGTSCDKSREKSTESHSTRKQEKKSNRQHSGRKADGGTNESQDANTEFEESINNNQDTCSSKSPDSSPTSLLPFKKRPLQHQSETDDGLDEYSCSTDSGKLILKLKKPKIASNIFEVKRIMQLRKSMAKMERRRFHNGKHNERKVRDFTKQTITEATGKMKEEVESNNLVDQQAPDFKDEEVTNQESTKPLEECSPSEQSLMSNKCQVQEVKNDNGTDLDVIMKDEVDNCSGDDSDNGLEDNDTNYKLKYFKKETAPCTESLASYIETYEKNLYSDPVCFTDCSESEDVSDPHSYSHVKCKVIKEIVEDYVRQNYGMDNNFLISVQEADCNTEGLQTQKAYNTLGTTETITLDDKEVSDTKSLQNRKEVGSSVEKTICNTSTVSNENITTIADSGHNKKPEHSKAKLYSTKKLPKGYVLELVPTETNEMENTKNSVPVNNKHDSSVDKNNVEHIQFDSSKILSNESHCSSSEPDKAIGVNHKSHNGPSKRYVVAGSDDEDTRGDDYNSDSNTVDKISSDDEKVPLSTDLIFHSLRDLMLESGMQKQISPEKITGIPEILPKPESKTKQKLLGRSRRPGLGRPPPGKGVAVNSSNGKISTTEFVLPLSPESDKSASSNEPNKKTVVGRDVTRAAQGELDTHKPNQDENKRTLRSAAGTHRGQRYSSDELYKPRPLFHVTSRRTKSKLLSTLSPVEEVSVKKRRSTVEGCESSASGKNTYR